MEELSMKSRRAQESLSMKAISEKSGVSIATVSRVINNNGRFSKDTRDRVLSVVNENGYVPNALAQGLRKNRIQNIGIIVPDITNEFFAKMTLYMQQAFFEQRYSTLIYNTDENAALEARHLQNLIAQNVSAIVFIAGGGGRQPELIPSIPTVFLDRTPPRTGKIARYISIHTDNFKGGYLAGRALLEGGCSNPAVVMDEISNKLERFRGFSQALSEAHIPVNSEAVYKLPSVNFETAYTTIGAAIDGGKLYDSYFCATDLLAIGTMTALLERHIAVPEQARIVGFDDISPASYCRVPLTTIHQDIKGMAALTVKIILDMLNGEDPEKHEFVFEPALVKRLSA
jgi:LacI family transcriptional regulator